MSGEATPAPSPPGVWAEIWVSADSVSGDSSAAVLPPSSVTEGTSEPSCRTWCGVGDNTNLRVRLIRIKPKALNKCSLSVYHYYGMIF